MRMPEVETYLSVVRPKRQLNHAKNLPVRPWVCRSLLGLSKSAARAGLSVRALNAEISTEMAMVMENCWYIRPVIPGIAAVGMNTAARMMAMAITGPPTSSIALNDA